MASQYDTAVIVGSLRKESFSLKIAKALTKLAPPSLQLDVVTLGGVSFYNEELEATPPADWVSFRERIKKADAVLFVTPEYNRSVPGVLKNAIDVGSRPYGQSVFNGKPGGVISNSPGAIGGFGANHHLRNHWFFSTFRFCSSPRPMSAASAMRSTRTANWSRRRCASFSKPTSRPLPAGWRSRRNRILRAVRLLAKP